LQLHDFPKGHFITGPKADKFVDERKGDKTSPDFQITTNKMQRFLIYLFLQMLYMFQAVPLPIIRST
jgi:hypothetical protein